MPEFKIVNPLEYGGWDELIGSHHGGTVFHSSAWAKVLVSSYGYVPRYLLSSCNDMILPAMEVPGFLSGRKGISLPFTDYCDPLLSDGKSFADTAALLAKVGKSYNWRSFELRCQDRSVSSTVASSTFLIHVLDLKHGKAKILSKVRDSTRRNVRKAEKEGITVDMSTSPDAMEEFYRLNLLTRKEHGLPPQPKRFFRYLAKEIEKGKLGVIATGYFRGKAIASAVYLQFKRKAVYKYGASDPRFLAYRGNNLVMWKAIEWFAERGFDSLCFGRTEPDNEGLRQFKTGWGAREEEIHYYRYDLRRSEYMQRRSLVKGIHNRLFRAMPIPINRIVGELFYKYVA